MNNNTYILVNSKVLPPVFERVLQAKELMASGKASSALQAAKLAGISRSAFYKYKDFVFKYTDNNDNTVNLSALLSDKAGVFSALTTELYKYGANIITLNQGIPVDGTANVSLTIKIDKLTEPIDKLLDQLSAVEGVISIKNINGGKND